MKNTYEALKKAKATPTKCSNCGSTLIGYTSIGYPNSELVRVCDCGKHNYYRYWGAGSEWLHDKPVEETQEGMSEKYRLMIYFTHSTLVMYEGSIISDAKMSVSEFRDKNESVCKRVFDEGLSIFNYELSYEQVNKGILVYLQSKYFPQKVENTKPYTRK